MRRHGAAFRIRRPTPSDARRHRTSGAMPSRVAAALVDGSGLAGLAGRRRPRRRRHRQGRRGQRPRRRRLRRRPGRDAAAPLERPVPAAAEQRGAFYGGPTGACTCRGRDAAGASGYSARAVMPLAFSAAGGARATRPSTTGGARRRRRVRLQHGLDARQLFMEPSITVAPTRRCARRHVPSRRRCATAADTADLGGDATAHAYRGPRRPVTTQSACILPCLARTARSIRFGSAPGLRPLLRTGSRPAFLPRAPRRSVTSTRRGHCVVRGHRNNNPSVSGTSNSSTASFVAPASSSDRRAASEERRRPGGYTNSGGM